MSPRLDTAEHVRREQAARIGNLHHRLEPVRLSPWQIVTSRPGELAILLIIGVLILGIFLFAMIGSAS